MSSKLEHLEHLKRCSPIKIDAQIAFYYDVCIDINVNVTIVGYQWIC